MTDPRKWKHFERLVAAIHKLADEGAEVRWNEVINGRQFDVAIRFKKGLYQYLTVIECKDHSRPVSVDAVDSFVTKSRDAGAHRGVIASSSGFQSGAREVADRHSITLIHVKETQDVDISMFWGAQWGEEVDVLHTKAITLEYADGERKELPKEANALEYYAKHTVIEVDKKRQALDTLLQNHLPEWVGGKLDDYKQRTILLTAGAKVVEPHDGEVPLKAVVRVHALVAMSKAKTIVGPVRFETYHLRPNIQVQDVASGEAETFSPHDLALGVDTVFDVGRFYEGPGTASYFYCDQIDGDVATIYQVESFQLGTLIQSEFRQKTEHANLYVEVTDEATLARLRRRLTKLKESA